MLTGNRSLIQNLGENEQKESRVLIQRGIKHKQLHTNAEMVQSLPENEEGENVSEHVEEVIGQLLTGLRDKVSFLLSPFWGSLFSLPIHT